METTELKKLMPPHVVDVQGHGINEFYTPEQVVEILRLLGVVGRSEQLKAFVEWWHSLSQEELVWYDGRYVEVFESL